LIWLLTGLCGLLVLLLPGEAHAWGPFTHLLLARSVLSQAAALPAGLGALLGSFTVDYLYGNLAADFTIAKNLASHLTHAHCWGNALKLLRHAGTDGERAFALGYLSHLAADGVAHNYFVPLKLVESYPDRWSNHALWEGRFDQASWEQVGPLDVHLVKGRFPANERLQASQIPGTIFSYPTNRFLFSGFFRVQNLRPWQQTMEQLALRSRSPITLEEREEALRLSREAIVTMLWELQHSRVPAVDPRGLVALAQARRVRTLLRRAARRGPWVPERILVRKYYQPAFRLAASGPWQLPSFPRLSASLSVPSS